MTALPIDTVADVVAGNDRALDVMDALVTRTGGEGLWGVRELADHLGASRSTVNRLLQGLTVRGLATETGGAYTVGPRLRVLTHALFDNHQALGRAQDIIGPLGTACDATVMVVLQSAQRSTAFIALVHERPGPIRYHLIPGMTLPLHAGAAGRAILERGGHRRPGRSRTTAVQRRNDHRPATAADGTRQGGTPGIRHQHRSAHPPRIRCGRPVPTGLRDRRCRVRDQIPVRDH